MHMVSDQPEVVKGSIHLFESSLTEAILIVLAVSFLSLGMRTGTVVALSIPLVLAITFFAMKVFGIDLQRISLGALVIALGLLVDDAIIAVEMMVVKMEQGWDRFKAATFAYTSTAFPDADRHADHGGRIHAGRFLQIGGERIHHLHFPGGDHRAAGFVGGGGGVHALTSATSCSIRRRSSPRRRSTARISTTRRSIAASGRC